MSKPRAVYFVWQTFIKRLVPTQDEIPYFFIYDVVTLSCGHEAFATFVTNLVILRHSLVQWNYLQVVDKMGSSSEFNMINDDCFDWLREQGLTHKVAYSVGIHSFMLDTLLEL